MRGSCGAHQHHSKVHDVGAGGPGAKERLDRIEERVGIVPFQMTTRVLGLRSCGNGRVHERARGIGRAIFAVGASTQDRNIAQAGWTQVNQGREHDLLIAPALPVVLVQGYRGFSAGQKTRRG